MKNPGFVRNIRHAWQLEIQTKFIDKWYCYDQSNESVDCFDAICYLRNMNHDRPQYILEYILATNNFMSQFPISTFFWRAYNYHE